MAQLTSAAWRNDGVAKVTGRTKYTDDIQLPGMLHAVPVYSEFVHARLTAVHTVMRREPRASSACSQHPT